MTAISLGSFGYNGPCGSLGGHCAVQKSIFFIYSINILLPPLPVPNRPKMELFVVGTSLQVRVTSGLPFGLTDTMGAVDSGAITPLLRTSGSACCPWAQVSHYVKVLLGVMNGDMSHAVTERHLCRVGRASCLNGPRGSKPGFGGFHPPVRSPCNSRRRLHQVGAADGLA